MQMPNLRKTAALLAFAAATIGLSMEASAQATLAQIKARGALNCQVGPSTAGFYSLGADGSWSGMDVDICRGLAAAIFDDPKKVQYQSVTSAVRFTALANGESDVLSRTTTWTAVRDTQLGLEFAGVNFYDGQGFMVPKALGRQESGQGAQRRHRSASLTGTTHGAQPRRAISAPTT